MTGRRGLAQLISCILAIVLILALLYNPWLGALHALAAVGSTYTVNSTGNGSDISPGNGVCETGIGNGVCTLRAAMQEADAHTGADTILFGTSIALLYPNSSLPPMTDPSGVTIRGNSVWISGTSAGANATCFELGTSNNKIQGLLITGFSGSAILINGGANNVIGTDGDGSNDANEGNYITGNDDYGVWILSGSNTIVAGNTIGNGGAAANTTGVLIQSGTGNLIGTNGDGVSDNLERNVISGNTQYGVYITGNTTGQNRVAGNYIGTESDGTSANPNGVVGVYIKNGSTYNFIGTNGDGQGDSVEGNVISGNSGSGVSIMDTGTNYNIVAGNYIGTNAAGDASLGNEVGIYLSAGASYNRIGSNGNGQSDSLERNVISGNSEDGIFIDGSATSQNVIAGNYIGLNASGTSALANDYGIFLSGALENTIGGSNAAKRNVISGNRMDGIHMQEDSGGIQILGNYIGTDANGSAARSNGGTGILISNGAENTIGGDSASERNVISGNTSDGIHISGSAVHVYDNVIQGNYIGVRANGYSVMGNGGDGIDLNSGASYTTIGGIEAGQGNVIAYNAYRGVKIPDYSCRNNSIRGNVIYDNSNIGIDLASAGVDGNDSGDGDVGANNLQNYPVLSSPKTNPARNKLTISGNLNSTASTNFALDFFGNYTCDTSGYGEGNEYLGSIQVSTNTSGDASFTVIYLLPVPTIYMITATATDPNGNTSEFSLCKTVETWYDVNLPVVLK